MIHVSYLLSLPTFNLVPCCSHRLPAKSFNTSLWKNRTWIFVCLCPLMISLLYQLFIFPFLFHLIENICWEFTIWLCTLLVSYLSSQFSRSIVSDSSQFHRLQHARLPCPSPTPGAYSNSCPLSRWCHPPISSSVIPVSSRLQSFPASGSFPVNWFFASHGQSIGVSSSASVFSIFRINFL